MAFKLEGAIAPVFVLLWSTGFIIAKLAMPYVEPATFLFWRYLGILLAMGALSLVWRPASWPNQSQLVHLLVAGMLLQFGEKNPGMVRVMVGDALVFEHDRLQQRMNLFFDKFDAALRQALRDAAPTSDTPTTDTNVLAGVLTAFAVGRLQRFARSGFRRVPTEQLDAALVLLLADA